MADENRPIVGEQRVEKLRRKRRTIQSPTTRHFETGKCLNTDFRIRELKPFLDEDELLSVGGRLQQSYFSYREKHPWILPNNYRYTEILVQYEHEKIMNADVRDT